MVNRAPSFTYSYLTCVRHLLYFPFIPYFIIFEHLVQGHAILGTVTTQQDLNLLSATASYYSSMRAEMQMLAPLCVRLENIATVFLRLAKLHIYRPDSLYSTQSLALESLQPLSSQSQKTSVLVNSTSMVYMQQIQTELGDEIGIDLEHYLQWIPPEMIPTQDSQSTEIPDGNLDEGPLVLEGAESLQAESRGTKRPFDVMFDWFAWDVYYGEQNFELT
jgi:hypothetical protein